MQGLSSTNFRAVGVGGRGRLETGGGRQIALTLIGP